MDQPDNKRFRFSWEWMLALALALGTFALLYRAHRRDQAYRAMQSASLQTALAQYRDFIAPVIKYGAKAPDFEVRNAEGKTITLKGSLKGARYLILAFLSGKGDEADLRTVGDLLSLSRQFSSKGVKAIALSEKWPSGIPRWLPNRLPFPILRDSNYRAMRAYGVHVLPTTILIDADGRIASVDGGNLPVAFVSYARQDLEKRLLGRIDYPRYDPPAKVVGRPFPDFLAETSDGEPFGIMDVQGRFSLLAVSDEKCHACGGLSETLAPAIDALRRRKGVCIWANLDSSGKSEKDNPPDATFIPICDPLGLLKIVDLGLALPNVVLIGADGKIRWIGEGPFDQKKMRAMIERIEAP